MARESDWAQPPIDETWVQKAELSDVGSDDSDWEEDEVTYLTLDFGQAVQPAMINSATQIQLLALNSATPFARVGAQLFQGTHQTLIGSEILLRRDTDATPAYAPLTTTQSRIAFNPIRLVPHPDPNEERATPAQKKHAPRKSTLAHPHTDQGERTSVGADSPARQEEAQKSSGLTASGKKRGRPKGSKNRPKPPLSSAATPEAEPSAEAHPGKAAEGCDTSPANEATLQEIAAQVGMTLDGPAPEAEP